MTTSDVYDEHREGAEVCELQLRDFGGTRSFSGRISTVRCHEDNVLLKQRLSDPGEGRVLVVDGGGRFAARSSATTSPASRATTAGQESS